MNLNTITVIGNLGHDPSLRNLDDGTAVCSFSLAVRRGKKDMPPMWLQVACFGKQAEACKQYLAKGARVGVTGALDIREYTGRDGTAKTSVTIAASQVDFLSESKPASKPVATPTAQISDEDIPF
jgi:single-strand DNA-binding protein